MLPASQGSVSGSVSGPTFQHSGCQKGRVSAILPGGPRSRNAMTIDRNARLRETRSWGDYHLLGIDSPPLGRAARPGQFVMVKAADGAVPLLRRPLSIHDAGPDGIELFFKVAGQGTAI